MSCKFILNRLVLHLLSLFYLKHEIHMSKLFYINMTNYDMFDNSFFNKTRGSVVYIKSNLCLLFFVINVGNSGFIRVTINIDKYNMGLTANYRHPSLDECM